MRRRRTYVALLAVTLAVLLQTTLFATVRPAGVAPDLVLLTVVAVAMYASTEESIIIGFATGLFSDALGDSLLGSWGLVLTVIAYLTAQLRERAEGNVLMVAAGVVGLTLLGESLFAVLGTLFGQRTLSDVGVVRTVLLTAAYNLVLAGLVVPVMRRLLRQQRPAGTWS